MSTAFSFCHFLKLYIQIQPKANTYIRLMVFPSLLQLVLTENASVLCGNYWYNNLLLIINMVLTCILGDQVISKKFKYRCKQGVKMH